MEKENGSCVKDGDEISRKVRTASGMKAFGLLPWLNCSLGGRSWWNTCKKVDTWICARMGREEGSVPGETQVTST